MNLNYMCLCNYNQLPVLCLFNRLAPSPTQPTSAINGVQLTLPQSCYRPYAKMAAVNFCHREEVFVNRNKLLHCKDQVKRNHYMKF